MESYRLINKLDYSNGSNKNVALKYDVGRIKTEKYGEATLSGHFLLINRHGEYPPIQVKPMEEKGYTWLKEMGLEDCHSNIIKRSQIPRLIACSTPGIDLEKLEVFFKSMTFAFLLDDAVTKLNHLNKNNTPKHQEDIIKLVESLVCIIKSHGSGTTTEAAISNLDPIFKNVCIALSYTCNYGLKRMPADNYERLARELMDFIRANKWLQEYRNSPFSEEEYLFWRLKDIGVNLALESIHFAKDIRIADEIRRHPLFIKYLDMLNTHVTLVNDIFSFRKETSDNERENIVLIKCQKFNLQKAIYKTEKAANKLIFDMKKCGIKLISYFPTDYRVKDFVKTTEIMVDGFIYWYQDCGRYGGVKFEKYEVKFDCDYNSWLKKICALNLENMKEPTLSD